jgi:hypothetical protein
MTDEDTHRMFTVIALTIAVTSLAVLLLTRCETADLKRDLRDLRQELHIHESRGH